MTTSRSSSHAVPSLSDPPADRAGRALWLTIALLTVARAVLTFVPSMWAWSLNLGRFMPPESGWIWWAIVVPALVPPLARALAPAAAAAGEAIARGHVWIRLT